MIWLAASMSLRLMDLPRTMEAWCRALAALTGEDASSARYTGPPMESSSWVWVRCSVTVIRSMGAVLA